MCLEQIENFLFFTLLGFRTPTPRFRPVSQTVLPESSILTSLTPSNSFPLPFNSQ